MRGEDSIAELCRRECISQGIYYKWPKDFKEAGKRRLAGDLARADTTDEVKDLRRERSKMLNTGTVSIVWQMGRQYCYPGMKSHSFSGIGVIASRLL